jgi:tRNA threonylcarbamoyladenosine biosynthesis protein TsaB
MALILNIDTAQEIASICVAENASVLAINHNEEQQDHAAWLHLAIGELLKKTGKTRSQLEAIAVSNGPGSYTGLRIGLSTAKGLCYALNVPLILISTLEMIAYASKDQEGDLLVPMIDARRMEVFTAIYDKQIRVKNSTHTLILQPGSFGDLLDVHKLIFCGNGSGKARKLITHSNAVYSPVRADTGHLSALSESCHREKDFADLAYSEPFYSKDFHSTTH